MITKKQLIKELVSEQKYDQLVLLATKKQSQTLKYIQMHLFADYNQPLRWHAIEALGKVARALASKEPEVYRNLIRRLLWAMNDESGNVPWGSPEAISSIIVNQPFLFGDLTPMLITNAYDNPMCHRGMIWAMGRIGKVKPSLVLPFVPLLLPYLEEKADDDLLGYAVWALGEIGYQDAKDILKNLMNVEQTTLIYKKGKLVQESIGNLAKEAVGKLEVAS